MSILVATDFSASSEAALQTAARLADKMNQALEVTHCVDIDKYSPPEDFPGGKTPSPEQVEGNALEKLKTWVDERLDRDTGLPLLEYHVELAHSAEGIVGLEDQNDYELVVIGATGRGAIASLFLGSTAEEVMRASTTPVMVVPEGTEAAEFQEVLAPVDYSPCSELGLKTAIDMAKVDNAFLRIMHSYVLPVEGMAPVGMKPLPEQKDTYQNYKTKHLDQFVEDFDVMLGNMDYTAEWSTGDPTSAILESIDRNGVDLVVIGTHGYRGLQRFFMGSTASKVVRKAPCPVVTARYVEQ